MSFRRSGRRREHLLYSCISSRVRTPSGQAVISPETSLECLRWRSILDGILTTFGGTVGNCLIILIFRYTVAAVSLSLRLGLMLGSLRLCACICGLLRALTWQTRLRLKHRLFESSATIRLSLSPFFALTIFSHNFSTLLRSSLTVRFFITARQSFSSLLPYDSYYELHHCFSSLRLRLCTSSRQKAKGLISSSTQQVLISSSTQLGEHPNFGLNAEEGFP